MDNANIEKNFLDEEGVTRLWQHTVAYVDERDGIFAELEAKLETIEEGAQVNINSDWNATGGSAQILNKPEFAIVATSGSYNDLNDKPAIPSIEGLATEAYVNEAINSAIGSAIGGSY